MTIIKDKEVTKIILRNIQAVMAGYNLEYEIDGVVKQLDSLDNSYFILDKCWIKNDKLECWVIMKNGKIFQQGNYTFYTSEEKAKGYIDRYCNTDDSCRIVHLKEI